MKKTLKFLYKTCGKLVDTLVSLLSVLFFSKFSVNKYFKKQQKIRKANECCYIFGNGSSLKSFLESNPQHLENVMVVNFFGSSSLFRELKPNMYIVLDNILIGRPVGDYPKEQVEKLYEDLQAVDWPMTFFYPSNGTRSIISSLLKNKNINIVTYNMTPVSGFKSICHWLFKKSLGMPRPQNISNAAVFCALNFGFRKIYLYGVEHSWMKNFSVDPDSHRIYLDDGHFYDKNNIEWLKKGEYCDFLSHIHMALKSHMELREYADSINAKVVNKTPTSFIEAYEFNEY